MTRLIYKILMPEADAQMRADGQLVLLALHHELERGVEGLVGAHLLTARLARALRAARS